MAQTAATADHQGMPLVQRPGALLRQIALDTVYLVLALPMGILTFTWAVTGWSVGLALLITFIGLPMKWKEGTGSPIRAVAVFDL